VKFIEEIGEEKRRGAFYTPPALVDACLDRLSALLDTQQPLRILEPSAGDGAFLRGMARAVEKNKFSCPQPTCLEIVDIEAAKCRAELIRYGLNGEVFADSFFEWASHSDLHYDAVIGNPPFIRYQFVAERDRLLAEWMLRAEGQELQGVSNLWIPFILLSLKYLKIGGAFAFVLPNELLSTISAGQVRSLLLRDFDKLRIDLFPRDSFPDILQDVLIVSGIRVEKSATSRQVTFSEKVCGTREEWIHTVASSHISWTRFLLTREQSQAFHILQSSPEFCSLGDAASIGVAIVTGANEFFTVAEQAVETYQLAHWIRPLLARTAESPGIEFRSNDFETARRKGKRSWLLDFSCERPDPLLEQGASRYLRMGEEQGLPKRYKCRIRSPWFRVPHIKQGRLMMAKRSHQHHRLILNTANVFTTDTIYRGEMKERFAGQEKNLAAGFHNSATLLSAELEGRTYGGGVLELVPSEIARLFVPMIDIASHLTALDEISRKAGGQQDQNDSLIAATDFLLAEKIPLYRDVLPVIAAARICLRNRRFHGSSLDI